jgi:hypothetical protein
VHTSPTCTRKEAAACLQQPASNMYLCMVFAKSLWLLHGKASMQSGWYCCSGSATPQGNIESVMHDRIPQSAQLNTCCISIVLLQVQVPTSCSIHPVPQPSRSAVSCIRTRSIGAPAAVLKSAFNLQRTHRWVEVCSVGVQRTCSAWGHSRNTRVQSTAIASIRVIHANRMCMQLFTRADACGLRMITCSPSSSSRPSCWQHSQFFPRHMQVCGN